MLASLGVLKAFRSGVQACLTFALLGQSEYASLHRPLAGCVPSGMGCVFAISR